MNHSMWCTTTGASVGEYNGLLICSSLSEELALVPGLVTEVYW